MSTASKYISEFIESIKYNKQLVLFAQREYINSTFGEYNQIDNIEDTNVPWDWDHIYPESWVYQMKNCERVIRDWNGTIGNIRAISLEQNRSENNNISPKTRLAELEIRKKSFVLEKDWQYWEQISDRIYMKELSKIHYRAIVTRMIEIYQKYWDDLKIYELIKS